MSEPRAEALRELARQTDAELGGAEPSPAPGAAAGGGGAAPAPDPAATTAGPPLEVKIAGLVAMVAGSAGKFLPSVAALYDESTCAELGKVLAPLARKYQLDRYLGDESPELAAVFALVPLAIATREAVRQDLAAAHAAARDASRRSASEAAQDAEIVSESKRAPKVAPVG